MTLYRHLYVASLSVSILAITAVTTSNRNSVRNGSSRDMRAPSDKTYHDIMSELKSFLSDSYDKEVFPHKANTKLGSKTKGTSISVWATILYVGDITNDMDFTVDMIFSQSWVDPRLKNLVPQSLSYLLVLGELVKEFWLPLTIVSNSKNTRVHTYPNKNSFLTLKHDGTLNYTLRIETTCWCRLDLSHYPFDNQTCQIVFEQFGHRKVEVQFTQPDKVPPLGFSPHCSYPTRFKLLEKNISSGASWRKYDHNYSSSILEIKFRFVRKAGPIIVQSHIPACLIVIISWLGFYVNRDSRFGLGVSLVLALSALSFSSGRAQNLGSITGTDIYTFACFLFVFFSLLEYGVVQFLGNRYRSKQRQRQSRNTDSSLNYTSQRKRKRPLLERRMFSTTEYTAIDMEDLSANNSLSAGLLSHYDEQSDINVDTRDTENTRDTETTSHTSQNSTRTSTRTSTPTNSNADRAMTKKIDFVSRCVLPCLFFIFNIIYWPCFVNRYNVVLHGNW